MEMTRDEKIIRNKVGVLELAKQLGSVSQAMGFSRDSFYRFKDLYAKGGEAALIEMSRRVPNPKNRIAETIERRVLELTVEQPAWGHTRMANELAKRRASGSPPPLCVACGSATTSTHHGEATEGAGGQGGTGGLDPD
jgi:winged helix-turn helix protein